MNTIPISFRFIIYLYLLIGFYGELGRDNPALMSIIFCLIAGFEYLHYLNNKNFELIKKLHDVNKTNSKALTLMNDNNKDLIHSVSKLLILLKKEKNSL